MPKIKIPEHMMEKLEDNLRLFDQADELTKKLHPKQKTVLSDLKTHEEKLKTILWLALCAHEDELNERIDRRKQILADRKGNESE